MATIGEAVLEFRTQLTNFKKGMDEAKTSLGKFGAAVRDNAQGFRNAGIAIGAFSAAVIGLGTKGVMSAAKFESQLQNVATMLDNTTMKFMPEYKKGLENLAQKYGESTATLSKGLYDILSASVDAEKALDVLDASAQLARGGLTDTGVAADALTTIINAYQMSADKATDISDLLFAVVKRGKTTMGELAPAVGMVATTASTAGLSLEEMGAMLATMTRSGLNTRTAVVSLNMAMTGILKPTKQAKEAAKELGLELNTTTLREKGLIGMVDILNTATDEQLARIFPNIRAFRGLAVALNDTTGYEKDLQIMTNRTGYTQEAFGKQTDTVTFSFEVFTQKVEALWRKLGETLLPAVETGIDYFSEFIDYINDTNTAFTKIIVVGGAFIGILGVMLSPILLMIGYLPQIALGFKAIGSALTLLSAHPIIALAIAVVGLGTIFTKYFNRRIDQQLTEQENELRLSKTIKGRIKLIKKEMEEIKTLATSAEVNEKYRIELLENYNKKQKQLKFYEQKLAEETEKKKTEAARIEAEKQKQIDKEQSKIKEAQAGAEAERLAAIKQAELDRKAEAQRMYDEAMYEHQVEQGQITLEQQRIDLEQQLANVRGNLIKELEVKRKIWQLETKIAGERSKTIVGGFKKAIEEMKKKQIDWANNFTQLFNDIQDSFKSGIVNMLKGANNFKEGIKTITDGIKNAFFDMIAKVIAEWIMQHIIMKAITKAWKVYEIKSAAGVAAARAAAAAAWSLFASVAIGAAVGAAVIAMANQFRDGVRNFEGGMAIVGEQGAELVSLPKGSNVYSHSDSLGIARNIRTNAGSGNIVKLGDINIDIASVSKDNISEICDQLTEAVKEGNMPAINLVKAISKEGGFRSDEVY